MTVVLETRDLTKRFGGFVAVDHVDLTVPEGVIKAVIGPNGAGKTTLFNLLTGVYEPTEGQIEFEGTDITGEPVHERPHIGISRSYQITNIFTEMTVFENVQTAVGIMDHSYYDMVTRVEHIDDVGDRAEAVLDLVGLASERDVEAAALSHGDKRRLEVGLALASEPTLLLLDEPMAGMGSHETEQMIDLIDDVASDTTILLIEHDIRYVMEVSDEIAVLEQGSFIADGEPGEIRDDDQVQRAYLGGSDA